MWKGTVVSIHITHAESAPMIDIEEAHAVPGRGIEGDRYFLGTGHFSPHFGPAYEMTLIEIETIEAMRRDDGIEIEPREARRNVVTAGVPLNHLVGREFMVGEVRARGIRLCEPCFHLTQLIDPNSLSSLIHRGGLRAQILTEGVFRPGDPIFMIEE
ncbi:MAG: hypothetical protein IMW89_14960 [Ktedonobacteraceae bacterium]|nr:hypothetical protein [Ktedonobacteraceae bacterium]